MGSGFQAIVLNVGVAAAAPFSVNKIPKIAIASPPTLVDSIITETVAGDITIGTDPNPAATETLRFFGGLISDTAAGSDTFIAGRGAVGVTIASAFNVQIGTLSRCDNSGGGGATVNTTLNVVLGYNAGLTQGVGSSVIISPDFIFGGSFPFGNLVAIGYGITVNNAATGPLVGTAISAQGRGLAYGNQITSTAVNNWVCIGTAARVQANNATVVGDGAHGDHATSIVFGRNGQSTKANQLVAGGTNLGITEILIGEGDTAPAPNTVTWRQTNASGNNVDAGNMVWLAGLNTGNASTGGRHRFQVGQVPAGAAATLQTIVTPLEVRAAAGSKTDPYITLDSSADAAAAGAGTIGNAPHAGDPDIWVAFWIGGVARAAPFWNV